MTTSFRVERDLLDRFRRAARERDDRSASAQLRRLMAEYVESEHATQEAA